MMGGGFIYFYREAPQVGWPGIDLGPGCFVESTFRQLARRGDIPSESFSTKLSRAKHPSITPCKVSAVNLVPVVARARCLSDPRDPYCPMEDSKPLSRKWVDKSSDTSRVCPSCAGIAARI